MTEETSKMKAFFQNLKKEQIVLLVTAVILFIMLLFPPYHIVIKHAGTERIINEGYGFIIIPPFDNEWEGFTPTVNITLLGLQCVIVSVIGGLLHVVFKEKNN